jgi:hypothetical protein
MRRGTCGEKRPTDVIDRGARLLIALLPTLFGGGASSTGDIVPLSISQ